MALSNAERQRRYRQRRGEAVGTAATLEAANADLRRQVEALTAEVERLRSAGPDAAPAGRYVGPLDPHPVPLDTLTDDELVEVTRQRSPIVQPALDWLGEPNEVLRARMRDLESRWRERLKARGVEVAAKVRQATGSKHATIAALAKRSKIDARWIMHLVERDEAPAMAQGSEWIESRRWKFLEAIERAAGAMQGAR